MPRTGDTTFAQTFNKRFGGRAWRVTHGKDPVPNLPPDVLIVDWGFEHVEPEMYFKANVDDGYEVCTEAHQNEKCVEQYWNVPLHLTLNLPDHLKYLGVDTSIFGCSSSESVVV